MAAGSDCPALVRAQAPVRVALALFGLAAGGGPCLVGRQGGSEREGCRAVQ